MTSGKNDTKINYIVFLDREQLKMQYVFQMHSALQYMFWQIFFYFLSIAEMGSLFPHRLGLRLRSNLFLIFFMPICFQEKPDLHPVVPSQMTYSST
jgi:hypothetical protein